MQPEHISPLFTHHTSFSKQATSDKRTKMGLICHFSPLSVCLPPRPSPHQSHHITSRSTPRTQGLGNTGHVPPLTLLTAFPEASPQSPFPLPPPSLDYSTQYFAPVVQHRLVVERPELCRVCLSSTHPTKTWSLATHSVSLLPFVFFGPVIIALHRCIVAGHYAKQTLGKKSQIRLPLPF